jgi:hypothetical protein
MVVICGSLVVAVGSGDRWSASLLSKRRTENPARYKVPGEETAAPEGEPAFRAARAARTGEFRTVPLLFPFPQR